MDNQERLSALISVLKQRDGGKFREDVEDSKKIIGREVGSIREVSRTFRHYKDQYPDTYKDFCEETKDAIQYVDEEGRNTGVKWYPVLWDYLAKPQVIKDLERWLKDKGQPRGKGGQSSGGKITKEEANVRARPLIKANPSIKARQLAQQIPCSIGLVPQLPAWKALQEYKKKTFGGKKPKMIPLTKELEYMLGTKDEKLNQLIAEQAEDGKEKPRLYISKQT